MTGLIRELEDICALPRGTCNEAAAQAVAGVALWIESGAERQSLDDERDTLISESRSADRISAMHAAEEGAATDIGYH